MEMSLLPISLTNNVKQEEMKRILLLIVPLICAFEISAQMKFRTAELKRLAEAVSLDAKSLTEGYSYHASNGMTITVHQTRGIVDHVGRRLFSDDVRLQFDSQLLNFLERYFLQLKYPPEMIQANKMIRDDAFCFEDGELESIEDIMLTDDFSCNFNSYSYKASWSRGNTTILSVTFPVEYELISGENKIEAEKNIMEDIQNVKLSIPSDCQTFATDSYYLSQKLSNHLYKVGDEFVFSKRHPAESTANMMLSLEVAKRFNLNITQVCYGFKKNVFCVPLQQWIAFCRHTNCEMFFGIENISEDGDVDAIVIAKNEMENYNHVLTVHVPASLIEHRKGQLEGRLYPYVPTHNVANLFASYKKSNPKSFGNK